MHDTGITSGCAPEANCPDGTVTRCQMAAFLVRAVGLTATSSIDFTDDDGTIFDQNINKLATAGISRAATHRPTTSSAPTTRSPAARWRRSYSGHSKRLRTLGTGGSLPVKAPSPDLDAPLR